MDKIMVLSDKTKKRMGIICFIPVACFLFCFIYYLALILPATSGMHDPASVIAVTSSHYSVLFVILSASAIITAPVFIYCLVILARLRKLNAATKMKWIIFLSVMAPIASALFWLLLIKDSPRYVSIYPDIA